MSYLFQVFNLSFEIYISYWFSKSNPYPPIDFQNLPPTPLDEGIASEYLQLGMWK